MAEVQIRKAQRHDAFAMAKVRVSTWRATYQGIVSDDFLASLSVENVTERWTKAFWDEQHPGVGVFVAEGEHDEIVGIAICGPEQTHDAIYQSEIYILYVLPAYQDQGIGRKLVTACVEHLIGQLGVRTMLIWVLAENPYRRFYESLGGKPVREQTKDIGGKPLSEVGYGWKNIQHLRDKLHGTLPSIE